MRIAIAYATYTRVSYSMRDTTDTYIGTDASPAHPPSTRAPPDTPYRPLASEQLSGGRRRPPLGGTPAPGARPGQSARDDSPPQDVRATVRGHPAWRTALASPDGTPRFVMQLAGKHHLIL